MKRLEFYKAAMAAGMYKNKAWVISAFSIIQEDPKAWTLNPYPYRIVQTATGNFFCDPNDITKLEPIELLAPGSPIFRFRESIMMSAGDLPNLKKDIESTVGNVFFNYSCLVHCFNDKIEYKEGYVNINAIEEEIASRLEDSNSAVPNAILVSEYIKFVDSVFFLTNFSQLCTWGVTPKAMVAPPGIQEFKQSLLDKYKDRLHDPEIVATIDAELVKFDAAYLKGDPSENFLIEKKSRNIVRKKMFLMHGAEKSLSQQVDVDIIQNSLSQGWEIEKFAILNNSLRAGSFNRSSDTQLGGEAVKWLLRTSSNITVTEQDCGTKMGKRFSVTEKNVKKLVGFSIIIDNETKAINTPEEAGSYLGKTLMVRSPMYCKLDKTDFCLTCVGKNLATNPLALSMAISDYGSNFMGIFMKGSHGKALLLSKMDYKTAIS